MNPKKPRSGQVKYRLALEKIIGDASQRFINTSIHHIDSEIQTVLERMGEFAKVDRSYIFLFSEDQKSMSNSHEWCAPGVEPQIELLQDLSVENFPWIVRELQEGRYINIADLEELPPEASNEKELLEMQDIESLVIVPMSYDATLKGYLGFDSTREQVRWSDEDFSLLRTMGDIVVSALMRRQMENQLLQSYKMEALGRFAGGIAHDFNNILTTVKGNTQLLLSRRVRRDQTDRGNEEKSPRNRTPGLNGPALDAPKLDGEEREIAEAVIQAAESGSALTEQLLNFSRNREKKLETLHLNQLLEDILHMLERLIPEEISLENRFHTYDDTLSCDRSQIEQVVMNLVKNSADAISGKGYIVLRTQNVEFQNTELIRGSGVQPGKYILLQVSDNGRGMSRATTDRALEPFFSTKEPGEGTGLGLSTVYSIVQQHSGHIEIDSKKRKGTTVDIYLPVSITH